METTVTLLKYLIKILPIFVHLTHPRRSNFFPAALQNVQHYPENFVLITDILKDFPDSNHLIRGADQDVGNKRLTRYRHFEGYPGFKLP